MFATSICYLDDFFLLDVYDFRKNERIWSFWSASSLLMFKRYIFYNLRAPFIRVAATGPADSGALFARQATTSDGSRLRKPPFYAPSTVTSHVDHPSHVRTVTTIRRPPDHAARYGDAIQALEAQPWSSPQ